ncbi:hypothetical protein L9F63_003268, partial [Diploptera punctata]
WLTIKFKTIKYRQSEILKGDSIKTFFKDWILIIKANCRTHLHFNEFYSINRLTHPHSTHGKNELSQKVGRHREEPCHAFPNAEVGIAFKISAMNTKHLR